MFVRCTSNRTGAMQQGGIFSLVLPDCTAPDDEKKKGKTNNKKRKESRKISTSKNTKKKREGGKSLK